MGLLAAVAVLGVGIAMANAKTPPKKKPAIPPGPTPARVPIVTPSGEKEELEDLTEEGADDIIVETPPGPDGEPGATIVVDAKEVEAVVEAEASVDVDDDDADLPPIGPTDVDKKLEKIAAEKGITKEQAVAEVVEAVTDGQQAAPIAAVETSPALDPKGTVSFARALLVREELPGWKTDMKDAVAEWQAGVGLTNDGFFGIESAGRMAEEVGVLPLVRYWPKRTTSKKAAEAAYDQRISQTIDMLTESLPLSKAQIEALGYSMEREVAVSYGNPNPPAQDTGEFVQDTTDAIAATAQAAGEKELNS